MMIPDLQFFSELFWPFFTLTTSILMLWIGMLFRIQQSGASRLLLISAILDFPCSLFTSFYWHVWPYGFLEGDGFGDDTFWDSLESTISNLSTLLFLIWMVALLFVAIRSRKEREHLQEQQRILEQRIQQEPQSSTAPPKAG